MHDVCLRKIAPQTTATRHFSTTYDHITDSITTVSFYISGYLTPPALRHKSYTEPDRHSVLFCSVSSQPTRHTRHILPAASRYCNALFCHTPFNSIPAGQPPPNLSDLPCRPPVGTAMSSSVLPVHIRSGLHPLTDRLPMAVPFYSAMLHSGMPAPNLPDLPSRPPVGAAMLCSSRLRSIPLRLARVTTECRKPVSLFCYVSFRPVLPYSATNTHCTEADRFGSSITTKKNMHSTSAPSATRDTQLSSPRMRQENISQPNIPLLTILKYTSLVYDRAALAIVPLRPSAARLLHALSVEIQKIPSHYTAAIGSLCAEPHIKTGW